VVGEAGYRSPRDVADVLDCDSTQRMIRAEQDAEASAWLGRCRSTARGYPPKTFCLRDKDHRKFVSTQPCLVCGRTTGRPHHLRFAQPRAMSRKVSDEFTVPLCQMHHRELHSHDDEKRWWKNINDPLPALSLWKHSRIDRIAVCPTKADDRRDIQETTTMPTEGGIRP
jgi:hypothetical protein